MDYPYLEGDEPIKQSDEESGFEFLEETTPLISNHRTKWAKKRKKFDLDEVLYHARYVIIDQQSPDLLGWLESKLFGWERGSIFQNTKTKVKDWYTEKDEEKVNMRIENAIDNSEIPRRMTTKSKKGKPVIALAFAMFFKVYFLLPYLIYKIIFNKKSRFKKMGAFFFLLVFLIWGSIYSIPIMYFIWTKNPKIDTTGTNHLVYGPLSLLAVLSLIAASIESTRLHQNQKSTEELTMFKVTLEGDQLRTVVDEANKEIEKVNTNNATGNQKNSQKNKNKDRFAEEEKISSRSSGTTILKMIVDKQVSSVEKKRGIEFILIPFLFSIGFCLIPFIVRAAKGHYVWIKNDWYHKVMLMANFVALFFLIGIIYLINRVSIAIYKRQLTYQTHFTAMTSLTQSKKYEMPYLKISSIRNLISWIKIRTYIVSHILLPWTSAQMTLSYTFCTVIVLTITVIIKIWANDLLSSITLQLIYFLISLNIFLIWAVTVGSKIGDIEKNGITMILKEQLKTSFQIRTLQEEYKQPTLEQKNKLKKLRDLVSILTILIQILRQENSTKHILSFQISSGTLKLLIGILGSSTSALISHFVLMSTKK
ncbi:putative homeodomain transcription factor phtf [Anaeramoeba flamelloides]|uniref:Homeodomain transcription factor phtf n=1 Tax=Anaeramoeba flamelloides TaxID=1746091 RepID=A0ABQ8X7B1_9EUKA|nr:putative homeodomain transcription factor phtf [Anaeramoeba flamelloides]